MTDPGGAAGADRAGSVDPPREGLRGLLFRIVDSGIPAEMRSGDPDTLRRARIVLSFTLVLVLLGLEAVAFFAWVLEAESSRYVAVALVVGLLLTLAIPFSFRRTGSVDLGANLVIAGSYVVIVSCFTVVGGIRAPLLHWCALLPMLAVLMGSRRSAWLWAAVGFATLSLFVAADAVGWRFPDSLGLARVDGTTLWVQRFVDVGSWVGILLAVSLVYEARKEAQTRELAEKNLELQSEIEQRSRAEERTQYLAYYDELTTLPNRRLFQQQLRSAMEQASRHDRKVAVLFLDLDGFKEVNDTHGHALGDCLLQQAAERLRTCVRMSDSVARGGDANAGVVSRLGGDEFTILLTGIRGHREAALVSQRILECLENPFALGDHEVFISASIGVALYPGDVEGLDDLLRNADVAMYHAKDRGKNNFQFFEEQMNRDIVRHSTLVRALRKALDRDEFTIHYQPMVAALEHRIVGVEALVRWKRSGEGLVAAGEFIDVAEESGLIEPLGDWVVRQACQHYAKWRAAGVAPARLAVNVSGTQLRRGGIVTSVLEALRAADLEPDCLELEVTEGGVMVDEEEASRCLAQLKELGVRVALDDFGTGYSSLSYVKRFPVDSLKIDRSFVADIETDRQARAIATAIIAMAHEMGLTVVAEGVETGAQEQLLTQLGCDEFQGYRFSRPVAAEEMALLLIAGFPERV